MHLFSRLLIAAVLVFSGFMSAFAQEADEQQSTTGPVPPSSVLDKEQMKMLPLETGGASQTIAGVPGYAWRHGCGPTAVGMVLGYYDSHGFADLFDGDAGTQTESVDQGIASQGSGVRGTGLQRHYEDYALPMDDSAPAVLVDSSATYPDQCHPDDSIADFMHTSWSEDGNFYGWSWSSRVMSSFHSYVDLKNTDYISTAAQYRMSTGALSWEVLTREMDAGRPMVFLVDSDGNGGTDHFVTIVGYSDGPPRQYGCLDTWHPYSHVRWCNFEQMAAGKAWGVWGGWTFSLGYALTVNAEHGSVTRTPSQPGYAPGAEVSLLATAHTGYDFTGWSGDVPSGHETDNPLVLTMDAGKTVSALFAQRQYLLSYAAGAHGTVTGTVLQVVSHGGSGAPVYANAAPGHDFFLWSDGRTDNPRTDSNVVKNLSVAAYFISESAEGEETPSGLHVRLLTPDRLRVVIGATVSLTVEAMNTVGTVDYAWIKDGEAISDANSNTLILTSVTLAHEGKYRCEVADESKAIISSPQVALDVIPGLPLTSISLLALSSGLLAVGVSRLRSRRRASHSA